MGKVKKHSGLSKVLKVRKSGTVTLRKTGLNHKTGKKSGEKTQTGEQKIRIKKEKIIPHRKKDALPPGKRTLCTPFFPRLRSILTPHSEVFKFTN